MLPWPPIRAARPRFERAWLPILLCLLWPSAGRAQSRFDHPFVPVDLQRGGSGFELGPIVSGDFDGDGLTDFGFAGYQERTCQPYDDNRVSGMVRGSRTLAFERSCFLLPVDQSGFSSFPFVAADFDRDGITDAVAVNGLDGDGYGVAILSSHAACSQPVPFAVPPSFSACSVDLGGDAFLDLALGTTNSHVRFLAGDGHGGFSSGADVPVGIEPRLIAAADVDGDGDQDVLLSDGVVVHLLVRGPSSSFEERTIDSITDAKGALVVADLNHDGRPDVLTGAGTYFGNGDGTFVAGQSYGVNGAPVVGDFNEDGSVDVALTEGSVFLGTPAGVLVPGPRLPVGGSPLESGDFDGDGHLDLLAANGSGVLAMLLGHGNGTFGNPPKSYPTGRGPRVLLAHDLNGDGRDDLISLETASHQVSVLLADAAGGFGSPHGYDVGPDPMGAAIDDLDRDGVPDLVVTNNGNATLSILFGTGQGDFARQTTVNTLQHPRGVAIGDLDEDGQPDIVVFSGDSPYYAAGTIAVHGGGSQSFALDYTIQVTYATSVALGDVNGDGHLDLVCSAVRTLLGDGTGRFADVLGYDSPCGIDSFCDTGTGCYYGKAFLVANLDNDCIADAVSLHDAEIKTCYPNQLSFGYGGQGQDLCLYGGFSLRRPGVGVALGDFEGRGGPQPAILMRDALGTISVMGAQETLLGTLGTTALAAGDFDGDGRVDLAVANEAQDRVYIHRNLTTRTTIPPAPVVHVSSGEAQLQLTWGSGPGSVAGYRVYYGIHTLEDGTQASEGPSGISVPATATAFTLHCLPDSNFLLRVAAVDGEGRQEVCHLESVSARPMRAGGKLQLSASSGKGPSARTISAVLQLNPPFHVADVVAASLRINGQRPVEIMSGDPKATQELRLRFSQSFLTPSGGARLEGSLRGCSTLIALDVSGSLASGPVATAESLEPPNEESGDAPLLSFALHSIEPNPAKAEGAIRFDVPRTSSVRVRLYDIHGRQVAVLSDGVFSPGRKTLRWRASDYPAGLYFLRMEAMDFAATQKVIIAR